MRAISAKSSLFAPYLLSCQHREGDDMGIWRNVLLHIFSSSISKHLRRTRCIRNTSRDSHHLTASSSRITSVIPEALQGTRHHLLKSNNEDTICASVRDNITSQVQTSGTSTAVVVNVVNWDLGHSELVKHSLATGGVAVAVACNSLVDIVVVDMGIKHSLDTSLESELSIINLSSGLDEFGHAYAEDVAWLVAFDDHFDGVV